MHATPICSRCDFGEFTADDIWIGDAVRVLGVVHWVMDVHHGPGETLFVLRPHGEDTGIRVPTKLHELEALACPEHQLGIRSLPWPGEAAHLRRYLST